MLQPQRKCFGYYIIKGYEFASKSTIKDSLKEKIIRDLSTIDDSILIIDDIFDKSQKRNGKICLYKKIGMEGAIIRSELIKCEFFSNIIKIMEEMKTCKENRIKIIEKINKFLFLVYIGQQIDLSISKKEKVSKNTIKQYIKMISCFTGGHIEIGLEIGQIMANKEIEKNISKIGISLGRIRQIVDDFYDYFPGHHEIFGDFITHKNRIPEILFKLEGGDVKTIENLLVAGKYRDARNIILSNTIREKLYKYCKIEMNKIKKNKTDFDFSDIIEDFETMLTKE